MMVAEAFFYTAAVPVVRDRSSNSRSEWKAKRARQGRHSCHILHAVEEGAEYE